MGNVDVLNKLFDFLLNTPDSEIIIRKDPTELNSISVFCNSKFEASDVVNINNKFILPYIHVKNWQIYDSDIILAMISYLIDENNEKRKAYGEKVHS